MGLKQRKYSLHQGNIYADLYDELGIKVSTDETG